MGSLAPDKLLSVLEALKPVLKSIDVRTVAVAPSSEEHWQNLVTSFFVTEKTIDEVRKQQREIPPLRNNTFAIFLGAYPFDYTIFDEINKGEIRIPTRNKVQFRKFDPLELKVISTQKRIIEPELIHTLFPMVVFCLCFVACVGTGCIGPRTIT